MRRLVGRHAVIRVLVVWVIMAVTLYVLAFIPEIDFQAGALPSLSRP